MRNWKMIVLVFGCTFWLIPLLPLIFWLITILTYMISRSPNSNLGPDVTKATAVAGSSITGGMLIISGYKK